MPRPPARLADWFFSAPLKRRLLEVLFDEVPEAEWTELELAERLGCGRNGSLDEHLLALTQLGLLEQIGTRRYRVKRQAELDQHLQDLREALVSLVVALRHVRDEPVLRPNK